MCIAWGGSCLSVNLFHTWCLDCDVKLQAWRPQEKHTIIVQLPLPLLLLSLKDEDFHICILLHYLQSASMHADQVYMANWTTVGADMGCKELLFCCSERESQSLTRERNVKVSVSLATSRFFQSPISTMKSFLISEMINTITSTMQTCE